jgi:hypothetical protein
MKIAIIGHIEPSILKLIQLENDVKCIPIESAPKIPEERWLGHTFDIIQSEPINIE